MVVVEEVVGKVEVTEVARGADAEEVEWEEGKAAEV